MSSIPCRTPKPPTLYSIYTRGFWKNGKKKKKEDGKKWLYGKFDREAKGCRARLQISGACIRRGDTTGVVAEPGHQLHANYRRGR